MLYVVVLVRGIRIDVPVNVNRSHYWTEEEAKRARQAAQKLYPNGQIFGIY